MKRVDLPNGVGWIREPSDPPEATPPVLLDDSHARILAAVATVEKESPAAFAAELAKAKAAKPEPDAKEKS